MTVKSYKNVLFDLDGTLTEPALGITNSIMHSLKSFGIEVNNREELYPFIGPPLKESFMKYYHFDDAQADRALEVYREYFSVKGLFENEVYLGILTAMSELKESGKHLYLATSKPTCYSVRIMQHFGLDVHFEGMVGSNIDGTRVKKAEVIQYVIDEYKLVKQDTIMVGDREYDMAGAKECGIDALGVLYGYGSREELEGAGADRIVSTVEEMHAFLKR